MIGRVDFNDKIIIIY